MKTQSDVDSKRTELKAEREEARKKLTIDRIRSRLPSSRNILTSLLEIAEANATNYPHAQPSVDALSQLSELLNKDIGHVSESEYINGLSRTINRLDSCLQDVALNREIDINLAVYVSCRAAVSLTRGLLDVDRVFHRTTETAKRWIYDPLQERSVVSEEANFRENYYIAQSEEIRIKFDEAGRELEKLLRTMQQDDPGLYLPYDLIAIIASLEALQTMLKRYVAYTPLVEEANNTLTNLRKKKDLIELISPYILEVFKLILGQK